MVLSCNLLRLLVPQAFELSLCIGFSFYRFGLLFNLLSPFVMLKMMWERKVSFIIILKLTE